MIEELRNDVNKTGVDLDECYRQGALGIGYSHCQLRDVMHSTRQATWGTRTIPTVKGWTACFDPSKILMLEGARRFCQ